MTKEEFIKNCRSIGYCSKDVAEKYCEGKDEFTEDDYVEVFRRAQRIEQYNRDELNICGINIGKSIRSYKFYNKYNR